MAIEMEGREILYDHYKDTFEQQKGYLTKRDRLTVILMILVILLIDSSVIPSTLVVN